MAAYMTLTVMIWTDGESILKPGYLYTDVLDHYQV